MLLKTAHILMCMLRFFKNIFIQDALKSDFSPSVFRPEPQFLFMKGTVMSSLRNGFPGDHSRLDPPDPIPNSEVKRLSADDSVGFPHAKVGHCQDFIQA